jgi:5-bromo-4-chloroindolyl phosphate hydrolysis protein
VTVLVLIAGLVLWLALGYGMLGIILVIVGGVLTLLPLVGLGVVVAVVAALSPKRRR